MIPSGKALSPRVTGNEFREGEGMMTHIETARVNEVLGLQLGAVREFIGRLNSQDLEQLERDVTELEGALRELRVLLDSIPHKH